MAGTEAITLEAGQRRAIRRRLLAWYRRSKRDLPWRGDGDAPPDPYRVLVSEAMLQQTQVATVVPYFERFVAAWPTVADLAAAEERAVLRLWQGLGFYRRARHLHAAAKAIVAEHGGRVPDDVAALESLPGIGRYTAGAVASIAYGRPVPVVDGNVSRVLARVAGMAEPIDAPAGRRALWSLAAELVPRQNSGDFNQALMELGALVCVVGEPRCLVCPLSRRCAARASGRQAELPRRLARREPVAVAHTVVAIHRGGRWLFERRGDDGLWAGMWQMPTIESGRAACGAAGKNGETVERAQIERWVRERFGLRVTEPVAVGRFEHRTTHRRIAFGVVSARSRGGRLRPGRGTWRTLGDVQDLPLSNPQRRAIELVRVSVEGASENGSGTAPTPRRRRTRGRV